MQAYETLELRYVSTFELSCVPDYAMQEFIFVFVLRGSRRARSLSVLFFVDLTGLELSTLCT